MTRLLVSVRDLDEARAAFAGGADLIDLKEPRRGALGRCEPLVWKEVCDYVAGRRPVSAALGELTEEFPPWDALSAGGVSFAKIGLADTAAHDWESRWLIALRKLPSSVAPVAVAYADHEQARAPEPRRVLAAARRVGCRAFLLDTHGKQRGSLFARMRADQIADLTREAKRHGLLSLLAGSLDLDCLPRALALGPDYVAVRGALCRGDRQGVIDRSRVRDWAERIAASPAATIVS